MLINIGTKIKELRKSKKYTQEDLANAIGVTPQAISRWESNSGYPDMEIIPSIANFFGVSIDELFGYEYERTKKIDNIVFSVREKNKENNGVDVCIDECISILRGGIIEFPTNEKIMLCLAEVLYNAGYVRFNEHHTTDIDGYDVFDIEKNKQSTEWQEAIQIYEKLLTVLSHGSLYNKVVKDLNQLYAITGETDKAKLLALNSPDIFSCKELLILNSCNGKERAQEYEKALSKMISICSELMVSIVILNKNHFTPKQAVEKIENAIKLLDYADNNEYLDKVLNLYLYLSALQWKSTEHDKAFDSLNNAKEIATQYDIKYNLTKENSIKKELPEVWPWWSVQGFDKIKKEIQADNRWNKWVNECKI